MVGEIRADRESGGGIKLEHSQDQAGVHQYQTERGGECWERPLSCSGLAMAEYDDDDIYIQVTLDLHEFDLHVFEITQGPKFKYIFY